MLSESHAVIWTFVAGELVMFIAWVIGGGYYMGKILSRFDDAVTRLGKLEEKAERIDQHGTIYSQYNVKGELEKISEIVGRVTRLEMNARKLDVIAERVENINRQLTEGNKYHD